MVYLELTVRILVGLVFLSAAVGKISSPGRLRAFRAELASMRVVPGWAGGPVAALVWLAEVAVVGLLLTRSTAVVGFALAAALLVGFGAAIMLAIRRGSAARCRCFGFRADPFGIRQVVRNAALVGVCAAGVAVMVVGPVPPVAPVQLLPSALAGVALATVTIFLDDLAYLFRPV